MKINNLIYVYLGLHEIWEGKEWSVKSSVNLLFDMGAWLGTEQQKPLRLLVIMLYQTAYVLPDIWECKFGVEIWFETRDLQETHFSILILNTSYVAYMPLFEHGWKIKCVCYQTCYHRDCKSAGTRTQNPLTGLLSLWFFSGIEYFYTQKYILLSKRWTWTNTDQQFVRFVYFLFCFF